MHTYPPPAAKSSRPDSHVEIPGDRMITPVKYPSADVGQQVEDPGLPSLLGLPNGLDPNGIIARHFFGLRTSNNAVPEEQRKAA